MKKTKLKLFMLIIIMLITVPAFAQERIVDNANLLDSGQKQTLTRLVNYISETYNFDLVIVTERNIGTASPVDYADDFFDYNNYGKGQNMDGCLFLHVIDSRDYWFSTSGRGIDILNSYALNKAEADAVKHLRAGDYYQAYSSFLANWEEFLILDDNGRHYNLFYQYNVIILIISWALAFGIGVLVVLGWKNSMNTAIGKTQASAYVVPGSLTFREKKDTFLYSTVTKTMRQTQSTSGGGRTHTSSSGRSHGGGGGKY